MNYLKRPASEELLPTRAHKHPRITDSQDSTLWISLRGYFENLTNLVSQNFTAFIEAATENVGEPPLTPRRHNSMPTRPRIPPDFQRQRSTPPPPPPPPPPQNPLPNHVSPPPIQEFADTQQAMPILTSAHFGISHPALDAELTAAAQRRRKNSHLKHGAFSNRYESRDHIHAKSHKAWVQEVREQDKNELIQSLYDMKRRSGYSSDFKDFKGLLEYEQRLEFQQYGRNFLSASSSLTDLKSKSSTSKLRRHSTIEVSELSIPFLQRALQKAKLSLAGPKPIKPYMPSLEQLRLTARAKDDAIEQRLRPRRPPLPSSLPPGDEAAVDALLARRGAISKCVREQVSDKDISRLRPYQWLNDEVINFYGQMLLLRSEDSKENPFLSINETNCRVNGNVVGKTYYLNVHYFNTFFWTKLKDEGYEKGRLAKWTKKFDIFQKDIVLIPVNHNNAHWTAAAINFRKKRIESYDSMGMDRMMVYKLLREYLDSEHRNKKKKPFNFSEWEDWEYENTPQQENGYDCGVFTCQFLETLSRGEETFNFTQVDMPYLRRRMIWEIGNAQLRDDP